MQAFRRQSALADKRRRSARRGWLGGWARLAVVALSCGVAASGAARAADPFPAQPLRLLVGTPAGGTTDVIARIVAASMAETLGRPVVVDNRAGASGLIAAEAVAKAPADGYTLLMGPSQLSIYKALYPSSSLNAAADLESLGLVATSPYVMVVHPSHPAKSLAELLDYAKKHPGQVSYAGSTPGSLQHLGWEMIKRKAGVDMVYVPYKGTAALMPDLIGGRLQAGIDNVAILTPYIKNNQLRPLAVTSATRSALLPDVPTVAESGVPGFQAMGWFGVFATARLPADARQKLTEAVRKAAQSPALREKLAGLGAQPQSGDAGELRTLLDSEIKSWSQLIKEAGITAN